jgi:hypothetical protein
VCEQHGCHSGCGCGCSHHRHECGCGCGEHERYSHRGGYHHHHAHHGDCGHEGGCECEEQHPGHSGQAGFRRRFRSREEHIAELEAYLEDLRAEAAAVEERIDALKAA